jgi:hypothetical protein
LYSTSKKNPVVLSFVAPGTFVYTLSNAEQKHIKDVIVGKAKQGAMHILSSLPSMKSASFPLLIDVAEHGHF